MNHVWWAIVKFLQKLFVPPEYTPLERELLRQVSHLEGELFKERTKYEELTERLLFPTTGPTPEPKDDIAFTVANHSSPLRERAKQLSDLSHQRWLERAELMAEEAELKIKKRDSHAKEESSV